MASRVTFVFFSGVPIPANCAASGPYAETIPEQLLSVRRQRAVRRGPVRVLPRQSGIGAGAVARVFRSDAARDRAGQGGRGPRRGACADRRILRAARQAGHAAPVGDADRFDRRAQAGLCAAVDRRLPHPRLALGPARPAQAPGTPADSGTRAGFLRPDRNRHGHAVRRRQPVFRPGTHDPARNHQGPAPDLLQLGRNRVHVHHRPGAKALVAAALRVDPFRAHVLGRDQEACPGPADRGRDAGEVPAYPLRRAKALLAGRRREPHRLRSTS